MILDSAGQKGHWALDIDQRELQMGGAAGIISEVRLMLVALSTLHRWTVNCSSKLTAEVEVAEIEAERSRESGLQEAAYWAKICAYAQGFPIAFGCTKEYRLGINFSDIAKKFGAGGLHHSSIFLQKIADAFDGNTSLKNLLLSDYFADAMASKEAGLRKAVVLAAQSGIPAPSIFSALAYFDG